MAVAVVIVKINLFYEEQETTFVPLHQQVLVSRLPESDTLQLLSFEGSQQCEVHW